MATENRDSADDQHRSFRKIHGSSSSAMRRMIVDLAGCSSSRSRSQDWLQKMCFLQHIKPQDSSGTDSANISGQLDALKLSSPDCGPDTTVLKLHDRSTLPDPSAYIAVSYCWNRDIADWYDADGDPPIMVLHHDKSTKRSGIPPDVLNRTLAYAMTRSISSIWIDQECINQDDPADKEDAIQAMDLVYQGSSHPIAVLESSFKTQEEVDVFASIADPDIFEFDPDKTDALADILSHLAYDPWFTRAWTLQESVSSGVRMQLLIGCPDLEKPDVFGPNPDEFEISIWNFLQAMVNARNLIEEGLAGNIWEDTSTAIHASNCADELWNRIPTIIPDRFDQATNDGYRQQCTAAQAINFLAERHNSVQSDRLAILGNLCNYEIRIATRVLEKPSASFSTCALALAIVNGDMSLLAGYGEARGIPVKIDGVSAGDYRAIGDVFHGDERDSSHAGFGFSWGPKPTAKLSNIAYAEERAATFRLQPSTISADGLRVRGSLWHVQQEIMVPHTQALFQSKWAKEVGSTIDDESEERQRRLMLDFTITLIHELLDHGSPDLARTLWHFFEPYGPYQTYTGGYSQRHSFTFKEVFESKVSGSTRKNTSSPLDINEALKEQWSSPSLFIHPDMQEYLQSAPQRQLVEQACEEGRLLCGMPFVPTSSNPKSSGPRLVWFESTQMDDLVFTPFTQMGDAVAKSPYQYQAVSWAVERTGKSVDGCNVLRCLGRRRGFYRFAGLESADYILE